MSFGHYFTTERSSDCLGEETLLRLLRAPSPAERRAEIDVHLDSCPACRRLLSELARMQTGRDASANDRERLTAHPILQAGVAVGRYVIIEPLGAGGMGAVYAAHDPELRRRVALKLVPLDVAGDREDLLRARLVREARAMARLAHPNVIAVHDADSTGDNVFIAMDLVDGSNAAEWLVATPRHWREIVRVFVAAGRGLAAAHREGLVHRDFKPENILVGNDGRVCVTDFGLASDGTSGAGGASTIDVADDRLTRSSLVGTPAYMAPEQRAGRRTDARSDQFSYCASLFEALLGERPPGLPPRRRPVAPARGRVPLRLRRVLQRGLDADPSRRHPSMAALLAKLEPNRGRLVLATGAAATAAAVAIAVALAHSPRAERPCQGAADRIADVWGPAAKERVRDAILARPGVSPAETTWRAVEASLDRFAAGWAAMSTDACEATALRRDQSDEVLTLRQTCLAERREELAQAVAVLADPRTPVERARQVAGALTEVSICGEIALLSALVPPPTGRAQLDLMESVTRRLAYASAVNEAGFFEEAAKLARALVPDAERAGYLPLLAKVHVRIGNASLRAHHIADAKQSSYEALWAAEAGRDDETVARSWTALVYVNAQLDMSVDEEVRLTRHATAAIDRLASRSATRADAVRAELLHHLSLTARLRDGDLPRARALGEQALALGERALGRDAPRLVRWHIDHATVLIEAGNTEQARAHMAKAEQIAGRSPGDGLCPRTCRPASERACESHGAQNTN